MRWERSWKADPRAKWLADRHYNRQNAGSPQFVPPGRALVLYAPGAVWVTSAPYAEHVRHRWAGAWVNSLFRNEGAGLSSELITEAVAASVAEWGAPPELGIITFIDPAEVRSTNPGYCYLVAGFEHAGRTIDRNLVALQLRPERFPPAEASRPALARSVVRAAERGQEVLDVAPHADH